MFLLSYRGPSAGGGISSSLGTLWNHPASDMDAWWHMSEWGLMYSTTAHRAGLIHPIDADLIDKHYRFCNRFIWPLVHGFPDHVQYDDEEHKAYVELQQQVATAVLRRTQKHIFMHDYQFGFLPRKFRDSSFFWHIPWPHPSTVDPRFAPFLADLAANIALAQKIGFHTQQYADNYLRTLNTFDRKTAKHRVMVAPVAIDAELWHARAMEATPSTLSDKWTPPAVPFILSIDRADYAKGVVERLRTIDTLFEQSPSLREQIVFVQICQKTRDGIDAFDSYFNEAKKLMHEVQARWATSNWSPIIWLEESFNATELACLYKSAQGLLITSIKDGLNLTAKEFVACQRNSEAALIVSKNAGVVEQLYPYCFSIDPLDIRSATRTIAHALSCSNAERRIRMHAMKELVSQDSLLRWARAFSFEESVLSRHKGNTRNGA